MRPHAGPAGCRGSACLYVLVELGLGGGECGEGAEEGQGDGADAEGCESVTVGGGGVGGERGHGWLKLDRQIRARISRRASITSRSTGPVQGTV